MHTVRQRYKREVFVNAIAFYMTDASYYLVKYLSDQDKVRIIK